MLWISFTCNKRNESLKGLSKCRLRRLLATTKALKTLAEVAPINEWGSYMNRMFFDLCIKYSLEIVTQAYKAFIMLLCRNLLVVERTVSQPRYIYRARRQDVDRSDSNALPFQNWTYRNYLKFKFDSEMFACKLWRIPAVDYAAPFLGLRTVPRTDGALHQPTLCCRKRMRRRGETKVKLAGQCCHSVSTKSDSCRIKVNDQICAIWLESAFIFRWRFNRDSNRLNVS